MSKRNVGAGVVGTLGTKELCAAIPFWMNRKVETPPAPRLCCVRRAGHSDKKHQDARGHQWDVTGANKPGRSHRK